MKKHATYALIAMSAVAALWPSLPALAQSPAEGREYWHSGWEWGWGHMFVGSLMMLLFWGGIILLIVLAVRWFGSGASHGKAPGESRDRALEILQERFARGEIDKEEFEERKRLLRD